MRKSAFDNDRVEKIVALVDPGWRVLAVAVPTRAFRLIVNDSGLTFRVEQLESPTTKHGTHKWRTVSSHQGDTHYESYPSALQDMLKKQVKLKELIKLAAHKDKMAHIKANEATRTK
jgi:hypothetical protein